jgi:DNA-directed RNA polymerase subunit M/transcription elongation factor TFIIS
MKCPRCGGRILQEQDIHETYDKCINCGYEPYVAPRPVEIPTEMYYKRGSKAPPTRVYEDA